MTISLSNKRFRVDSNQDIASRSSGRGPNNVNFRDEYKEIHLENTRQFSQFMKNDKKCSILSYLIVTKKTITSVETYNTFD